MEKKAPKLKIKKGDLVKVIAGNNRGKEGRVLEMVREKGRAFVEGVNVVTKHKKKSQNNPEGGIDHTEASIHVSNLMLVDPSSGKPTKVGRKANDKGKMQRYSKKTGNFI